MLQVTMKIEKRFFYNAQGEPVPYTSYTAMIGGEEIVMKPNEGDKKLCEFLLKGEDLTPEGE